MGREDGGRRSWVAKGIPCYRMMEQRSMNSCAPLREGCGGAGWERWMRMGRLKDPGLTEVEGKTYKCPKQWKDV